MINNHTKRTGGRTFIVVVAFLAFISLGLPDGLLGIAWPNLSSRSGVALESLGAMLVAFTTGYLLTSSTSGKIAKHLPLGMLLTISCAVTAISLFTFAFVNVWHIVLIASFFLGAGGGAIDSSINTFAASNFSASTINWLHAFYGVGATAGPLLVTAMIASSIPWYFGYIAVASIQLALAILFLCTEKSWETKSGREEQEPNSGYLETLKLPVVWLYMMIFFLYTGLEQGFGQWLFTILTKSRDLSEERAGIWTSLYWGSLTLGRIVFGIVLTAIPIHRVLAAATLGICAGMTLFSIGISTETDLLGIIILGLSNAPLFPSLIAVTPERIGKRHAATAIGVQISMAMLGGALLPAIAGLTSHQIGLEVIPKIFTITAIIFAFLYFYAAAQHRRTLQ